MKPLIALILIVGIAGLVVLLMQDGAKPDAEAPAAPKITDPPEKRLDPRRFRADRAVPDGLGDSPGPAESRPSDPGAPRRLGELVRVSIEVSDRAKGIHRSEDGEITMSVFARGPDGNASGAPPLDRIVAIEAGRFEVFVSEPSILCFSKVRLGARVAVLADPFETHRVPEATEIRLSASWPEVTSLRVVDRDTLRPLDDVTAVVHGDGDGLRSLHPGVDLERADLLFRGASPLALPALAGKAGVLLFVGAKDHAWTLTKVDADVGGERQVALGPGGDLRVLLTGVPSEAIMVRVYAADDVGVATGHAGRRFAELPGQVGDRAVFAALAPGRYEVHADVGSVYPAPLCLAKTIVEVAAGGTSEVTLDVAPRPAIVEVPLAGVIVVPEEWGPVDPVLEILPKDGESARTGGVRSLDRTRMDETSKHPRVLRWNAGLVSPGTFLLTVMPFQVRRAVKVDDRGAADVRIEVPPPAEVRLRVVDDRTKGDIDGAVLTWVVEHSDEFAGYVPGRVVYDGPTRTHRFRAPIGSIVVGADAPGYIWKFETLRVGEGVNHLEIAMRRDQGVRLTLFDGDTIVPFEGNEETSDQVRLIDAQGRRSPPSRIAWARGSMTVFVDEPGVYEILLEKSPQGFDPLLPRRVTIAPGTIVDVGFTLIRSR